MNWSSAEFHLVCQALERIPTDNRKGFCVLSETFIHNKNCTDKIQHIV